MGIPGRCCGLALVHGESDLPKRYLEGFGPQRGFNPKLGDFFVSQLSDLEKSPNATATIGSQESSAVRAMRKHVSNPPNTEALA